MIDSTVKLLRQRGGRGGMGKVKRREREESTMVARKIMLGMLLNQRRRQSWTFSLNATRNSENLTALHSSNFRNMLDNLEMKSWSEGEPFPMLTAKMRNCHSQSRQRGEKI